MGKRKYIDKSGQYSREIYDLLFKGKVKAPKHIKGKKAKKAYKQQAKADAARFREQLGTFMQQRQELLGAEQFTQQQLEPGGFYESLPADAASMRSLVSGLQPLWERTAQGQMFDITPIREAAQRQFAREIGPGYLESRYAMGPSSSGFLGGFGQQARDLAFDLGALEAEINAPAQQAFLTGGGAGQALEAMAIPYGFQGQGLQRLLGLGGATRTSAESARPGAAPLVADFFGGPGTSLAQIEQGGRVLGGSGPYTQGGQAGGWFV